MDIYILINDSLPYLKIGYTTRSPEIRASELTSTGIPTSFRVVYKVYVEDCEKIEKLIHTELNNYRVSTNREFFKIDLTTAVSKIEELIKPINIVDSENDDLNFDAEEYIRGLVSRRETNEEYQDLELERANVFFSEVYAILEPINGAITRDGLKVVFSLHSDPDHVEITCDYSIPELPSEIILEKDSVFHCKKYDKFESVCVGSPQSCAKNILNYIEWASEEERLVRLNPPIEFKEVIRKGWDKFLIGQEIEIEEGDDLTWLSDDFLEYFCDNFCADFCKKYQIPNIIASSWNNLKYCYLVDDKIDNIILSFLQAQAPTQRDK